MTATPALPRGVYRLRPVFGLSSFVGFAVRYGYFDTYTVLSGSTVTIVDKLFYYFSHLGRVGYAAGCLEVCCPHGGCLFAEREQANTMWREVTF